jgi:GntR family transcriptional regulator, arabinose operon transcriptional repressor
MHVDWTMDHREESSLTALQQVFMRPDPPTAVFASFDPLAEMIYFLMPRLGLRVPEDISLVGFGGMWRDGVLTRRLTSVVVDEVATGRQAVSLLHEMRSGKRPIDDNAEIVLELSLSNGETLAVPASEKRKGLKRIVSPLQKDRTGGNGSRGLRPKEQQERR